MYVDQLFYQRVLCKHCFSERKKNCILFILLNLKHIKLRIFLHVKYVPVSVSTRDRIEIGGTLDNRILYVFSSHKKKTKVLCSFIHVRTCKIASSSLSAASNFAFLLINLFIQNVCACYCFQKGSKEMKEKKKKNGKTEMIMYTEITPLW